MNDIKRMLPYLGGSYDRLNGLSYISNPSDSNANVTVSSSLAVHHFILYHRLLTIYVLYILVFPHNYVFTHKF